MSEILDRIIEERRKQAIDYQNYLAQLLDTARKVGTGESDREYPAWADNGARRALADFFYPTRISPSRLTRPSGTPSRMPGSVTR